MKVITRLRGVGHVAYLAGGCVRDLLLGRQPEDFDVATDALPERVGQLFSGTRKVGAQFGVVLVRQAGRWIEVATFRSDGEYRDGRRPEQVTFSDARADAARRDFTINGMFLDPESRTVVDFVGGRVDLNARLVRAIGDPRQRFAEDHLRLLRAVRFAARLDFRLDEATATAMRESAGQLARVAPERVREELARMLEDAHRVRAWDLLIACGLANQLWTGANFGLEETLHIRDRLARLPANAGFIAAFAALVSESGPDELERIARGLAFSNEQREALHWVVKHSAELDRPTEVARSALKRLAAHSSFPALRAFVESRYQGMPDGPVRAAELEQRLQDLGPGELLPPPLITGADLLGRGLPVGPRYGEILDALYTRQLDEELNTRADAEAALERILSVDRPGAGKTASEESG